MRIIHHYTDITSLALILNSKKIRFTRLDKVDDITESKYYGHYNLSNYIFVSCWTYSEDESIPQWKMYTNNMKGEMISFPEDFFKKKMVTSGIRNGIHIYGEAETYFDTSDLMPGNYYILPIYHGPNGKEFFYKDIIYVENEDDLRLKYSKLVTREVLDGKVSFGINDPSLFGRYKIKDWSFQKETRFVLFILPALPKAPQNSKDHANNVSYIVNCLENNIKPPLDYFDMDIDENILDKINVTLGPKCSSAEKIIVESLLHKYTNNGNIIISKFSGKIQ